MSSSCSSCSSAPTDEPHASAASRPPCSLHTSCSCSGVSTLYRRSCSGGSRLVSEKHWCGKSVVGSRSIGRVVWAGEDEEKTRRNGASSSCVRRVATSTEVSRTGAIAPTGAPTRRGATFPRDRKGRRYPGRQQDA